MHPGNFDLVWSRLHTKFMPFVIKTNDRLEHLIGYALMAFERPPVVFRLLAAFKDGKEFSGLSEVRISTDRELKKFIDHFEFQHPDLVFFVVREILNAIWDNLQQIDMDDIEPKMSPAFTDKLSWSLLKRYASFLLGEVEEAPWEAHTERIVVRLWSLQDSNIKDRRAVYKKFMLNRSHVIGHQAMVLLGKETCLEEGPRCSICPLRNECDFPKTQAAQNAAPNAAPS